MKRKLEIRSLLIIFIVTTFLFSCENKSRTFTIIDSPPFYLAYAPDSLRTTSPISIRGQDINGIPVVDLLPSPLEYDTNYPAFIMYESSDIDPTQGTFVRMENDTDYVVIPTLRIHSEVAIATIFHQSDIRYWGTKKPSKKVNVSGMQVDVWDVNLPVCIQIGCDIDFLKKDFGRYLSEEWGKKKSEDSFGATFPDCEYQPSQVSVTQDSVSGGYTADVASHIPVLKQDIYVPSDASFSSLENCSDSDVQALSNQALDHESIHAIMNLEWQEGKHGSNTVEGMTVKFKRARSPEYAKIFAYNTWCRKNVDPITNGIAESFHNSENGKIDFSNISCACALGQPERDPKEPKINCRGASATVTPAPSCEMTYCPCNDPSHGKPRNYSSVTECAVQCPSGLACFTAQCIVPPDCNK